MNMAVVGAARVVFGADSSEFDSTARGVEGVLGRLVDKFHAVEQRIKNIGAAATIGITLPFAVMTRAVDKTAGSFEGQMKRVEAALGNISGDELKQLSDQARTLGPAVGKGATEAGSAIEALGLAGVSTSDILGEALKAALDLSAAGMVAASASSSLVTDVMSQFKATAEQLPGVVQNVVGALDTSKFGFDDFRLAVGQGGAVAASAGVNFMDFATAISATSTQFSSGSDAGTSFKTYIQSLVGNSNEAKGAMKKLGIEFFDANDKMKPLAEQAQILRDKLGNLTDASKTEALKTIFGSDAARTAIGLMEQGAAGFEKLQSAIAGGDVEAKIAKRLEGSEAASNRIANAWESLKIAFGIEGGLLTPLTALKNGYASLLETISNAPPAVLKIGAMFSALGAAIGPLIMIIGHVGALFLANFAAARFGMIGRAIGLIIAPISTIITMLGEYGLVRILTMVGSRLLAFLGPVGIAISAFLMFKDHIIGALRAVWTEITATLGPPIEAIIAKVQATFAKLSGGSIGAAIGGLIEMLGGLKDFIGTGLTAGIMVAGEIIERTLGVIVAAFGGLVDVVSGVVDVISALLTGDFAGAWNAIVGVVESVFGAIVDMAAAIVPELGGELRAVYEMAKAWLSDGFSSIIGWMTGTVRAGVDYVASTFPNVVAAAKSVYQGVKGWLVDKFGALITWIGNAAKWIGDKYSALKERLGLGAAGGNAGPAAPPKPAAAPTAPAPSKPKQSVNFDDPKTKKPKGGGGGGRAKKERDPAEDAAERAQLAVQNELEAARLRGDRAAEEALRRKLDLQKQIEAYQRTGLSLTAATAAAARDMATLDAARLDGLAKDLERDAAAHQIEVARVSGNRSLAETLERQRELTDRIRGFERDGLTLAEATLRAQRQQLDVDKARADVRARMLRDAEQDRQLELARLRGDSEASIRERERAIWIRKRAEDVAADGTVDEGAAGDQAAREWSEQEKARQTGVFRETFKDGVRAALDGDLKGWIKNWWKDRVAKGMEEALNSLSDLIMNLFSRVGGSGSSGGGIGGILASIGGAIFGKGAPTPSAGIVEGDDVLGPLLGRMGFPRIPGFKTGGTGVVKGRSGVDANVVALRATAGEIVDIRRPGNDNGPGGVYISMPITYSGAVDIADKPFVAKMAEAARISAINGVMEARRRGG